MKNNTSSPKTFLFTTWEGGGNMAPVITVARKLQWRGHRVRLMSDPANRDDARAAGIEFSPWQTAPHRADRTPATCPLRDWEVANPPEGIQRLLDRIMFGPALDYARDLIAELERAPADVVVTNEMLLGVLAGCESRGQCAAILAPNLCLFPLPGMPVFGPGLPPPRSPAEQSMHEQIRSGTLAMLNARLDVLNRARIALGLLPLQHALDQLKAAGIYLLATSRAFDFPAATLPDQIRYVGPQLQEPGWVQPWTPPWPATDARPLVAVAFSTTYQAHEGVLQKVVDAAGSLPVRTLVTLGPIAPDAICPSANTALVASAPHDQVMPKAAVIITHGGHGTVMRALMHRRPMLLIPHGRDQDENAVRVTERGAGLKLPASATRGEIQAAIERLLSEPSFAKAAETLGSTIAAETREDNVVELLEQCAAGSARTGCATH
jgi:MGT family glycosyltransferase